MVEGSNQSPMKQTWKRLWQMNVPNKVRHFAWKAYRKILSMKENLRRRNITKDSTCDVCGKQVVTISHLFWSATMQKRCGPHANSPSRLKSNHRGSIWTWYGFFKSGRRHGQEFWSEQSWFARGHGKIRMKQDMGASSEVDWQWQKALLACWRNFK